MKLKDITIGSRLTLGFTAILFLVVILGIISYNQANKLWQNTDDLYNHPLIVGRATREIESHVLKIHVIMKDIALDEKFTEDQIRSAALRIDSLEIEVYKKFDVVYAQYLGSKPTIDSASSHFKNWKVFRDELISLRINKGYSEAYSRFVNVNKAFVENMISEIEKMITFSNDKASSFYTFAEEEKSKLNTRLTILLILIFISAVTILYILIKIIRTPLRELEKVADQYSLGKYDARSKYVSENEIGNLAAAFNKMASAVQADIIIKENAAWVAQLMMNENDLRPFCKGLLNALITKTESQIAAIYMLNPNTEKFEHFESIGLSESNIRNFSARSAEGEFGKLIAEKQIVRITDIPEDTPFTFPVVAGDFKPREIITIPLIENNEIFAILSLASIRYYSELSVRLIQDIKVIITARLLGVMNYQKIKDFSTVLDMQNKELDQKSKELVMQSDELKEYNIELELQKKQLDESNKLKSAFLSNMSHELRTPLNSVIALSGVLIRRMKGILPDDEYNYLGIIERNGKNLLSLINDILDLSRIEAGKVEIAYSQFSMHALIEEIIKSLEPIFAEKGISVSLLISEGLPDIISDNNKCRHIMQNIISNAVKFTEKGSVDISVEVLKYDIQIKVKDTGLGISDEFLPYIFDEFRQADDKTSRKFGGTGLGLSIVKKYCQLLNGSVSVSSIPGKGSEFMVLLPLAHPDIQMFEKTNNSMYDSGIKLVGSVSETDAKAGVGKTILLVEDNESQIIQLNDILLVEGYNILVARNGREALSIIESVKPDSIILDLQMPDIDGFEVLKEIRNLEETKKIPVLILTAKHITRAELSFLKENNIYQLIQKGSVNRNELLRHVNNLNSKTDRSDSLRYGKNQAGTLSSHKPHILLIDDNTDSVTTIKALLEDRFLISSANDVIEGLQMASSLNPDIILLDISLQGMDVSKVLNKLKTDEKLLQVPVVALTARAMKGDREELLASGFDGYISIPIDNETIENTLKECLANRVTEKLQEPKTKRL